MDRIAPPLAAFDLVAAARRIAASAAFRAGELDHDGAFPAQDVADLAQAGLLAAPARRDAGGLALGDEPGAWALAEVLRLVGYGSLALGRIYEGHVNALQLVARYGDARQRQALSADARAGHLFGVWNTEPAQGGLILSESGGELALAGVKTFASGAGFVTRALVTARRRQGDVPLMIVAPLQPADRADLSSWHAHGMRASATGIVDFTGIFLASEAVLGGPDDYHQQPFFSGGAWRFAAVHLGGIEAVFDAWRTHLASAGRGSDPHQLARLGEGAMAVETARLWVGRAARIVSDEALPAARIVAFVNLARLAVERAGLEVLQLAQRSVGLQGFLRDHPLERLTRDLSTYLRQPAPDRALTTAATEVLQADGVASDLWRPGAGGT